MRVLPYRQFTIETRLAAGVVCVRLSDATEESRAFGASTPRLPLVGTVRGSSFDVMRNVAGRNSFRPCIRGTVEATPTGARLTGTMRLHGLMVAFLGVYMVGASLVLVWAAARSVTSGHLEPAVLVALGVLAFVMVLTSGAFAVEVRRSGNELTKLLDGSRMDIL